MTEPNSKIIVIIDNYKFDVTKYANDHPGGYEILKKYNGKDATEEFNNVGGHCDTYVDELLDKFCIGPVDK
tara:strand:+ start:31 stop:243 length:213 start_codon:yes stop_codon:yes gene_type:complete